MATQNASDEKSDTRQRKAWLWYAPLLVLVFLLGCYDLKNCDIWWHLRTGQLIWQRGTVPRTDWFTYTNPDAPWIDLHWGFQLAVAGLWALGGSAALVLAKSAVGTAAVGLCLTTNRPHWPAWQTVACWLPAVLLLSGRYAVRPEMVSILWLAATLAVLHHAAERPRLLWLLPAIQLAWVNMHALFVLQLVVLGCYLADYAARLCWYGPAGMAQRPPWRLLLAACVLVLLASLVNPYGIHGTLFPRVLARRLQGPQREFYHMFSDELVGLDKLIHERGWSFLVGSVPNIMLLVVFFGAAIGLAVLASRGRFPLYHALLLAAFAWLAWQMVRNTALFAVVGGVVLRGTFGQLAQGDADEPSATKPPRATRKTFKAKRHRTKAKQNSGGDSRHPRLRLLPALVGLCLGVLLLLTASGVYHGTILKSFNRRFGLGQSRRYCHEAARFLDRAGMPRYIYALNACQASVCIFHLGPERRVFADARLETNRRRTLTRYFQITLWLAAGDPRAETELVRDIPPDADGRRPLPALVLDNRTLYIGSQNQFRLLDRLTRGGRWRCVYASWFKPAGPDDMDAILDGSCVFLARELAERLQLPAVPLTPLEQLIARQRQSQSGR